MGSVPPAKVAAITAAVLSHVEAEAAMPRAAPPPAPPSAPAPTFSPWVASGRQSSMFERADRQRRLSKSW
jgi:hypothetical protein